MSFFLISAAVVFCLVAALMLAWLYQGFVKDRQALAYGPHAADDVAERPLPPERLDRPEQQERR